MADGDDSETGGAGPENREPGSAGNGIEIGAIFGDGVTVIDPGAAGNTGTSGTGDSGGGTGKRRGRPPGSGNKQKAKPSHDISGIEKLLFGIHQGIAAITHVPEMALDKSEAHDLAVAFSDVSKHYAVLDKVSDKAVDHVNLVVALGAVYGPRIAAIKMRQAAEAKTAQPEPVTRLRPVG